MSRTSLSLAGFQLIIIGRFWVTAEGTQPNGAICGTLASGFRLRTCNSGILPLSGTTT